MTNPSSDRSQAVQPAAVGAAPRSTEPTPDPLWREKVAALSASPDGMALAGPEGRLAWANEAFARLQGFSDPSDLVRRLDSAPWTALFPAEARRRLEEEVLPTLTPAGTWRGELQARRREGGGFPLELTLIELEGGGLALTARDLSRRRGQEEALASREELFRLLADNANDIVALHEPDGTVVYVSPSVERVLGYRVAEMLGRDFSEFTDPVQRTRIDACLIAAAAGHPGRCTWLVRTADGEERWLETAAQPVRHTGDEEGFRQVETTSRDITERKALEHALAHRALHDPLTELPNRSLFMNRVQGADARARRRGERFGIVFLDLDGFKRINDSLGHGAGDELLVAVARRLDDWVRESDTVARLGGDEFGVLLEGISDPASVATLVDRLAAAFDEPFEVAGGLVQVRPSIGVALSGDGEERGEELLHLADQAMYRAKRSDVTDRCFHGMPIGS